MNQETTQSSSQENIQPEASSSTISQKPSATTNEVPNFGWSSYAERMNGRFAMIGFLAILLIEIFTKKSSFLHWAGLIQ